MIEQSRGLNDDAAIRRKVDASDYVIIEQQPTVVFIHLKQMGAEEILQYEDYPIELIAYIFKNRPDVKFTWIKPDEFYLSEMSSVMQAFTSKLEKEMAQYLRSSLEEGRIAILNSYKTLHEK